MGMSYRIRFRNLLISICLNCILSLVTLGQQASLVTHLNEQRILDHALILTDPEANMVFDKIDQSLFHPFQFNLLSDQAEVYWLKFKINNEEDREHTMFTSSFFFDSVTVYRVNHERSSLIPEKGKHGYLISPEQRAYDYSQSSIIPLRIMPNQENEFVLRLHNYSKSGQKLVKTSFRMAFILYSTAAFKYRYGFLQFFNYFLAGLLTLTVLYNLLIFVWMRESIYGFLLIQSFASYSWVLFSGGLIIASGLIENLEWERYLRINLPFVIWHTVYPLFVADFLQLKKNSKTQFYSLVSLPVFYIIFSIEPLVNYEIGLFFKQLISVITYTLIPFVCYKAVRRGERFAGYLLAGSIILLTAAALFIYYLNDLSLNYQTGHVYLLIGLTAEVLIFTVATSQRMGILKLSNIQISREKDAIALELEEKNRKLIAYTTTRIRQNEEIEELQEVLTHSEGKTVELQKRLAQLRDFDTNWSTFKLYFESVYSDFFASLNKNHTNLTPNEERLAAFIKMGLTSKEIAGLQNVTKRAVDKARERLKKKMSIQTEINLTDYIKHI